MEVTTVKHALREKREERNVASPRRWDLILAQWKHPCPAALSCPCDGASGAARPPPTARPAQKTARLTGGNSRQEVWELALISAWDETFLTVPSRPFLSTYFIMVAQVISDLDALSTVPYSPRLEGC